MNEPIVEDDDAPRPVMSSKVESALYWFFAGVGGIFFFVFGIYVLVQAKRGNYLFADTAQAFINILCFMIALGFLVIKYCDWRFKSHEAFLEAVSFSYFLIALECLKVFLISSILSTMCIGMLVVLSKV